MLLPQLLQLHRLQKGRAEPRRKDPPACHGVGEADEPQRQLPDAVQADQQQEQEVDSLRGAGVHLGEQPGHPPLLDDAEHRDRRGGRHQGRVLQSSSWGVRKVQAPVNILYGDIQPESRP